MIDVGIDEDAGMNSIVIILDAIVVALAMMMMEFGRTTAL